MNISPFLSVDQPCDETLQWTKKQLSQANLRVIQTFDLHTARIGLHDCSCSNHGTDECDCQMVVLLVYGKGIEPVTLVLHGNNGQSWLSLADSPRQPRDSTLALAIQRALGMEDRIPFSGLE